MTTRYEIVLGDCLQVLKQLPTESCHSLVTDPPYGLSSEPDIAEVMRHWLAGGHYDHGMAGFMGKDWDSFVPGPEYWGECYRVLKPGAYGLVFAGTRTMDLMSIALRFAGFEIRDTLCWMYGQGFPKSLDVSKAIDKAAGAEREVTREAVEELRPGAVISFDQRSRERRDIAATDAAKQWQGWGTALKPAYEPIILVRKPLTGTVAENVLAHGVGGINVDGCRIGTEARINPPAGNKPGGNSLNMAVVGMPQDAAPTTTTGRWPANVLLQHAEGCKLIGKRKVKSGVSGGRRGFADEFVGGKDSDRSLTTRQSYNGPDGNEEIDAYECEPDCPVRLLDEQSADRGMHSAGAARDGSTAVVADNTGRWPANVLLQHAEGCKLIGKRKVKASAPPTGPTRAGASMVGPTGLGSGRGEAPNYADANGNKEIDAYECEPDCPVRLLDEQSGELKAGVAVRRNGGGGKPGGNKRTTGEYKGSQGDDEGYGDSGGASRFFKTFGGEEWLRRKSFGQNADGVTERCVACGTVIAPNDAVISQNLGGHRPERHCGEASTNAMPIESKQSAAPSTLTIQNTDEKCLLVSPEPSSTEKSIRVSSAEQGRLTGIMTTTGFLPLCAGCAAGVTSAITPPSADLGVVGSVARFIYTAKTSKRERNEGCEHLYWKRTDDGFVYVEKAAWAQLDPKDRAQGNIHPTVKPRELMRWCCRLVTPPDGIVLDPFAGSGSTICAALLEGFRAYGIELEAVSHSIALWRTHAVAAKATTP